MKARPSDFRKASKAPLRESLGIPVLKTTSKPAPSAKAKNKIDIAYDIDSLEKLVDTFEQREGRLKAALKGDAR